MEGVSGGLSNVLLREARTLSTKIFDLSSPIRSGMPVFYEMRGRWGIGGVMLGTFRDYEETAAMRGVDPPLFRSCIVVMGDHAGTHVDSNAHFNPFGETIDHFPLDGASGPAVLLDVTHLAPLEYEPETERYSRVEWITADELDRAARRSGGVRPGDIVLLKTGASRHFPSWRYARTLTPLAPDGLDWLIGRRVRLYGIDQTTVDYPPHYAVPHLRMRECVCQHIENLSNLDALPEGRFQLLAHPLRWQGGSASPIRVVAALAEEGGRGRLLDLSHPLPLPADVPAFERDGVAVLDYQNIRLTGYQDTKLLVFSDHASTHIEAQAHFNPAGRTIDEVPLEWVTDVPCTWADCSGVGAEIGPEELRRGLKSPAGEAGAVLIYTGHCRLSGSRSYAHQDCSLTRAGLAWLLDCGVRVVGIDAPEVEADDRRFPAHSLMRDRDFCLLENVNLWPAVLELPATFRLTTLPLRLDGCTASPVRVVVRMDS